MAKQLEQNLEKNRGLHEEIKRAKAELHRLPVLDGIHRELLESRARIKSLEGRYGTDMSKWPGHSISSYNEFKEKAERAEETMNVTKTKRGQIVSRIESLQGQLATIDRLVSTKELLRLKAAFDGLVQKSGYLHGLVKEEEGRLDEEGQGDRRTLAQLTKEKEDLLADIACGEPANEKRLAAIELEMQQAGESHDSHVDTLITSSQKIAGLKRKIEQVEKELAAAKTNYLEGLSLYLDQELEGAGAEYAQAACTLAGLYAKVIALSAILEKCGTPRAIFGPYTRRFELPSFLLDSCMSQDLPDKPGTLFRFNAGDIQEKIGDEIERLGSLGIDINDTITAPL